MSRCRFGSEEDFGWQVAVNCLSRGYFYYVKGTVPAHKNPEKIDKKLTEIYETDVSKWTRVRRKKSGLANVRYFRFRQTFLLMATEGAHYFKHAERECICDFRRKTLHIGNYSISVCDRGSGIKVSVKIA